MKKLLAVCAGALLTAACGPVQSMTVIWEASAQIEGARAAEAQKYAPYEFVTAEAFLDKALEEQSYADFEPAIDFGTKAREMAKKALELSERATTKAPADKPVEPPPTLDATARAAFGKRPTPPALPPTQKPPKKPRRPTGTRSLRERRGRRLA